MLDAGADYEVCATEPISLNDVSASGFSSLIWTTSGDGTFSNPEVANPLYFPGEEDLASGSAELTITLSPVAPCSDFATGTKLLSVAYPPTADAGSDITACGEPVVLNGEADNFGSILWITDGDGTFEVIDELNTIYYPGTIDLDNKEAQLTLTASANEPCTVAATDAIQLGFDILELNEDLVEDKVINKGNLLFLSFSVSSLSQGQYSWLFNGEVIPGQNGPLLFLTNMQPENAGYYQGKFTNDCGTIETNIGFVEVIESYSHQINLPIGWSGISSFVTPDDAELESVFAEIIGDVELMANNNGIFWPGENVNTLGDFSVTEGYKIKMNGATDLAISGNIRYPFNELTIAPGWSYLPVNTNCAVNIGEEFGALDEIVMIKDIAGTGIYWPALGINTIGELLPGKAYFILNESATAINVIYAGCDDPFAGMNLKTSNVSLESPWNNVAITPASHIFGFQSAATGNLQNGDVVGAFNSANMCNGLMVIDHTNTANSMVIFGEDTFAGQPNGLTSGDALTFKLFRAADEEEFDLELNFAVNSPDQDKYESHGMSIVKNIKFKSTTSVEQYGHLNPDISIYPNPTSGELNVAIGQGTFISGQLMLINLNGQVVLQQKFENQDVIHLDLNNTAKGVYHLKIVNGDFVKIEKVVLK
jgi:hypothetical protein